MASYSRIGVDDWGLPISRVISLHQIDMGNNTLRRRLLMVALPIKAKVNRKEGGGSAGE